MTKYSYKRAKSDEEIAGYSFRDEVWFQQLAEAIFNEISRLKVCTMRQLTQGRFKNINKHFFIEALDSLKGRLTEKWCGSFTQYSVRTEPLREEKPITFVDFAIPKKNPNKEVRPLFKSLYGKEY